MKRILPVFFLVIIFYYSFSQVPQKISYQAVVRNNGILVTNQSVGMRVTILQGVSILSEVYKEIYLINPETNSNGLLTVEIGSGVPIPPSPNFSMIDWSSSPTYIKTEIDITGGFIYTLIDTNQLLSVPYALYASSGNITGVAGGDLGGLYPNPLVNGLQGYPIDNSSPQSGQFLGWNGTAWTPIPINTGATGPASGDLTGIYPNPQVSGLQGNPISNAMPQNGQLLGWDGTSWLPTNSSSIYILNSGNFLTAIPGDDKLINIQGTITLSGNYNNLNNPRCFITGGNIDGNGTFNIGSNSVVSSVTFNNIIIDGNNIQFINCNFNGITQLPFGCGLTGCQISGSTITTVTKIGYITNSTISGSTIPRIDKITNSYISGSTLGSSSWSIGQISNSKISSSTIYLTGTFTGNTSDETQIIINNSGYSNNITGNIFKTNSMTTSIIDINLNTGFVFEINVSGNNFLGSTSYPTDQFIRIFGSYTGTRSITKISNNIVIGGTAVFVSSQYTGSADLMVNDNDLLYTGGLGVTQGGFIYTRDNVIH